MLHELLAPAALSLNKPPAWLVHGERERRSLVPNRESASVSDTFFLQVLSLPATPDRTGQVGHSNCQHVAPENRLHAQGSYHGILDIPHSSSVAHPSVSVLRGMNFRLVRVVGSKWPATAPITLILGNRLQR
jgi:hypothetical protein